jgi:hypothetical protein
MAPAHAQGLLGWEMTGQHNLQGSALHPNSPIVRVIAEVCFGTWDVAVDRSGRPKQVASSHHQRAMTLAMIYPSRPKGMRTKPAFARRKGGQGCGDGMIFGSPAPRLHQRW